MRCASGTLFLHIWDRNNFGSIVIFLLVYWFRSKLRPYLSDTCMKVLIKPDHRDLPQGLSSLKSPLILIFYPEQSGLSTRLWKNVGKLKLCDFYFRNLHGINDLKSVKRPINYRNGWIFPGMLFFIIGHFFYYPNKKNGFYSQEEVFDQIFHYFFLWTGKCQMYQFFEEKKWLANVFTISWILALLQ